LNGLKEVFKECKKLDINFHLLLGSPGTEIPNFVKTYGVGGVVCDFSPLRVPLEWVNEVKGKVRIL
jgi:deoxyribodipyrimidine photo-lyase